MKIALGIIIAVLVMLLAGLGWYAFTLMQENEAHLTTINTMNESATAGPECTPLDSSGIATTMTDTSAAGDDMYCVTGADLSAAYTTEQIAMKNSAELHTVLTASTLAVAECMTEEKFINESVANTSICDDVPEVKNWPDVTEYSAQWGGCEFMIDKEQQTFSYCAQANAGAVITCTQDGCSESATMAIHEAEPMPAVAEEELEAEMIDPTVDPEPAPQDPMIIEPAEADDTPPLL